MQGVLFVLEIIFVMFLWSKQLIPVLLWVLSIIMFQMSFETGNERIYLEIIEDYPIQDCVKPRRFKFLYKKLYKLSYKDIPKEMYRCETIKVYGFIIYSILAILMLFINEYLASLFGGIYIGFYAILSILSIYLLKRKSFVERYKLLNRHNIRYLFLPDNEPYPSKIGKCQIMSESKRGGRVFVTVKILETDEVKERVLLQGKKRQGNNPVYSLYEICNVFYIV